MVVHNYLTATHALILVKAAGTAIPSFTSTLISDNLAAGTSPVHDEEDIKGVAGTLYGGAFPRLSDPGSRLRRSLFTWFTLWIAAADTVGAIQKPVIEFVALAEPSCFSETSATLAAFFLAMILHPEVFAKAQAEIDRVVGTDRLPDFQDRTSLPYVESLVKEVYRYGSLPPK